MNSQLQIYPNEKTVFRNDDKDALRLIKILAQAIVLDVNNKTVDYRDVKYAQSIIELVKELSNP